jgi:predicted extracellular nuclease
VGLDAAAIDGGGLGDLAGADVAHPPAASLSIATFNVARFFDLSCDTGECGIYDYEAYPTPSEFNAQRAKLVTAIETLGADIVLLQEVESQACLEALLEKVGGTYAFAELGETGWPASLDVATLSVTQIVDVRRHQNYSIPHPGGGWTKFAREFLEVHIDYKGWRVIVFNTHFRSKVNDDPGRRLAEAMKARELVEESALEFPHALIILGGDMNDVPGSAPLNELEIKGGLLRVASDIPSGNDWTYNYSGSLKAIDHLLITSQGRGAYVKGSATVLRDPGLSGLGGSDHGALRAIFEIKP